MCNVYITIYYTLKYDNNSIYSYEVTYNDNIKQK